MSLYRRRFGSQRVDLQDSHVHIRIAEGSPQAAAIASDQRWIPQNLNQLCLPQLGQWAKISRGGVSSCNNRKDSEACVMSFLPFKGRSQP
ncbi:MAG TPA: hypothetical protein VK003_11380 [Oceanobacillus sp.]|nr:hypothetical protein [Oceanobacillus sp.]